MCCVNKSHAKLSVYMHFIFQQGSEDDSEAEVAEEVRTFVFPVSSFSTYSVLRVRT